jgi:GAF domain/PilZ domain
MRHKVHTPAFASFDGVTGGMILDLSEEGLAMQTAVPLEARRRLDLRLDFSDPPTHVETTGYVAWADALGRAGVRLSELPAEARARLKTWLTLNDAAPSRKAPTLVVTPSPALSQHNGSDGAHTPLAISLEPETSPSGNQQVPGASTTMQYQFKSLGGDLNAALHRIADRARSLTRGTGAAIALGRAGAMVCRASVGESVPPLGAKLHSNSGFSAECVRIGQALRCDDAEIDPRVDVENCRFFCIRSIAAAPIQYQREIVGLLEVISPWPFAFDEGDVAIVERLARTVLLILSQTSNILH